MRDPETFWRTRSAHYNDLAWAREGSFLDFFVRLSSPVAHDVALDVGTGTGIVGLELARHVSRVIGIDISKDMIEKITAPPPNFSTAVMDVTDMTFEDCAFDLITARMVFHHVEALDAAMGECLRVLKPGGRMAICEGVPPDYAVRERFEEIFRLKEERRTFYESDLINLLCQNGFERVALFPYHLRQQSLRRWLENSGTDAGVSAEIMRLHREADAHFKSVYRMNERDGDIFIDWKFAVVIGVRP